MWNPSPKWETGFNHECRSVNVFNVRLSCYILVASRRYTFVSAYFARSSTTSRILGPVVWTRGSPWKRLKETSGNVGERERFYVTPVPEGKRRDRAFIYISFESGRPVITAAALTLFLLLFLFSQSLSIFSVSLGLPLLRLHLPSVFLSLSLSLFLHFDTTTSINPSTQTPPTDTASLLAGPLAGRIIKVPEGDGQSESRDTSTNKDEKDSAEEEVEEEEEGAGGEEDIGGGEAASVAVAAMELITAV